jgi:predicted sugar kinase
LSVLSDITRFKAKYRISIERKSEEHVGLASNAMLSLASAVAFNELLGCPFTNREIRKIIGYNYVELVKKPSRDEPLGKLSYGINTGSSHAVGLYGGIILMTTGLEIVSYMPFPEDEEILLYIPKGKKTKETSGEKEAERLFDYVRKLDGQQAQGRVYKVFMDVIPAMRQRKSKVIGNFLEEILVQGHQQSLFSKVYNNNVLDAIRMFREQGANMCGISSGGPTIFATGDIVTLNKIQENLISRFGANRDEIYVFEGSAGLEYIVDDAESKRYKLNIENA